MSHSVFQTAQIMPLAPATKSLSSKPLQPIATVSLRSSPPPLAGRRRRHYFAVVASSSSLVDGDANAHLERCFQAPPDAPSSSSVGFGPTMKGGQYGAFGAVTLEKSKLDMTKKETKSSPQLFDRKFVDAVLNEWQKTIMDLPAGLRQAYEMGMISSAQLVKFLAINARPTTARFISRSLPQGLSRAFIGRMIADPAFMLRMLLEQGSTIGCSVLWEIQNRKERIKQEWDLALINVLTVTACNAIVVWSLAPCRSYGTTFQTDLQNTLQKLPNNIFESSYRYREFDIQKRLLSFLYRAAELSMVGFTAGAAQGALSNFVARKKEGRLSVSVPSVSTNALGYGAFLGLYANLRYQLLCGFESAATSYFDVIGVALFFSTALRVLNVQVGESSRLAWLGVEADPLVHSEDLLKAYNRPSEGVNQSSSKWFISKNAIVSGLGLLGIKQGQPDSKVEGDAPAPKARRKRIVKRKVATS
ncbi:protein RETICULATA-RELATED 1, chloroplastic-like [Salvia divinorum]|uniref:Protein RETICULATA-RELATED 1, chloroplastic-like n=1 Tax=Salvia divinorum TaxID=28513 RepID=A0ABD1FRY3_SALDI